MIIDDFGIYPPGGNTVQGIWQPVSNTNTIGLVGLLGKVVANSLNVAATDVATGVTTPTDGDTVTIAGQTYRFKTTIAAIGDIHINGSLTNALTNLKSAINGTGTAGTDYYTGTPVNLYVTATASTATTISISSIESGSVGNLLAVASSATNIAWATATLAGGVDGSSYQPLTQCAWEIVTSAADYPTDILCDDRSTDTDTTNIGKTISVAPLDACVQFRVPVVGSGNAGDLMILAPSPNLGSVQPLTGSVPGTYTRTFQALESYQTGQSVLLRKYYGTQT